MTTRRSSLCAVLLAAAACTSDLPRSNPFDPSAPPSVQAKARLVGTVELESVDGNADRSGVTVLVERLGLETTTSQDGSWVIADVPPGNYSVEAFKDGYARDTVSGIVVELSAGGGEVAVPALALRRARGSLTGFATLEGEELFDGVTVALSGSAGAAQTDSRGRFVIAGVPTGTYELAFTKLAFLEVKVGQVVVSPDATTEVASVSLSPNPGSITGRVRVHGAANNSGVLVTADGMTLGGRRNVVQLTTTLDSTGATPDGAFTLSNVAAGLYNVSFSLENYSSRTATVSVAPAVDAVLPAVDLEPATGTATGTATLEGGLDHAGILVSLRPEPSEALPAPEIAAVALTDGEGSWRVEGLRAGRYDVLYSRRPGFADRTGTVTVVRDATVMAPGVVLAAIPGSVAGRVLLEGQGAQGDLSGTAVSVDNGPSLTTDAEGRFSLEASAGAHALQFRREGFRTGRVQVAVAPGDALALDDVTLTRARGGVFGALEVEGRPADASGVLVTLSSATEGSFTALTDPTGAFRFTEVPTGDWLLNASLPNYEPLPPTQVQVPADRTVAAPDPAGPPASRTLALRRDASLGGQVSLELGGPLTAAKVGLSGLDVNGSTVVRPAQSVAEDGSFLFEELAPGSYQVRLTEPEHEPLELPVVPLAAGQSALLSPVRMSFSRGAVFGTLLVEGRPSNASGILVALKNTTRPALSTLTALTDALGSFRFVGVPLGVWTLDASLASYHAIPTASVTVLADQEVEAPASSGPASSRTLYLRRDATLVGSVVASSGAAVAGVSIELSGDDLNGAPVTKNASTGEAGGFSLESLPPGTFRLSFSLADHEPIELGPVALPAGQAVGLAAVTLQRSRGDAAGQFLLSGAQSHANVRVTLSGTGAIAGFSADALTDPTGRFTAVGLPVGTYDVQATKAPDWTPASGTMTVQRNRSSLLLNSPLSLQVIAAAGVSGKVTVDRGLADGTAVRLRGEDLRGVAVDESRVAAADGSFGFSNLVGGNYRLTYERSNYETWNSSLFAVASGAQVSVPDVVLRISRGEIGGTVRLEAASVPGFDPGADWSGVRVALMDESGAEVASTTTDVAGAFVFTNVAVATVSGLEHVVRATREHFAPAGIEVVVPAAAAASVGPIALELQPGAMTGLAYPHDNVGDAGRNSDRTGVSLSVSGVAYNGVPFSKAGATSAADGTWSLDGLPPGTFEVHAASAGRRCEGGGSFPVRAGRATETGEVDCYDTRAPGALVLAAVPAWTNAESLEVALAGAATDPTEPQPNLQGYQYVRGRLPDWSVPDGFSTSGPFTFALTANAENTLWVRAIDWLGNAGPPSYVTVRHDAAVPGQPTVLTPRAYLDTTTTTISLSGAESEANFDTYLFCSEEFAANSVCPAEPGCQLRSSAASFALPLTPGRRTCAWARIRDLAGNQGPVSAPVSILCDTTRPAAPKISPIYEPSAFTARAKSVDVFVTTYSLSDLPLSTMAQLGKGIDHLEVDSGTGFVPLCPQCRSASDAEVWDPCATGCACDALVQCATVGRRVGAQWVTTRELRSLRVPLVDGTTNRISVRAVDLAGNLGDSASITVAAEGMRVFAQGAGTQSAPRFYKGSVAFADSGGVRYAPLDVNRTPSSSGCLIPSGNTDYLRIRSCESQAIAESLAAPGDQGLAVIAKATVNSWSFDALKRLPVGEACPGGAVTLKELPSLTATRFFAGVAASGKNLGWVETENWNSATKDEKEVFTCQLDDCLLPGRQHSLGPAAGPGHMASLRAGGDYLLWAASATVDCPSPKYKWKLAYVSRAPAWQAGKVYEVGAVVWPSASPNGHAYRALSAATSGTVEPVWPTGTAELVVEGTGMRWQELSFEFEAEHATLSADGKYLFTADNTGELTWEPGSTYSYMQMVRPRTPNGFVYVMWSSSGAAENQGLSGSSEPAWPTAANATVVDGEITWFAIPESSAKEGGNPPAIYRVRESGTDRLWGTEDDTVVENVAIGEMAEGGLAIEAGRAVSISSSFDKGITVWDAAPDGLFKADPTYLRHLVAKGGEPKSVELDQGLLVYSYGSDLVATDLSTLRWESAVEWEEDPVLAEDGTILFRRGGAERSFVARAPDGTETAGVLPGYGENDNGEVGPVLAGKDLILPSTGSIAVLNAGVDGVFFTADDQLPTQVQQPTERIRRLTAGGGNAVWLIGDDDMAVDGYVLLRQPGKSLAESVPEKLAPAGKLMPYATPAVSETFVAWMESGGPATMAVQYVGNGALGGLSDIDCSHFAAMVGQPTWCSEAKWQVEVRQVVASGPKLLVMFIPYGETQARLVVLDPGPNGRFGSSLDLMLEREWDDRIVEVPLGSLSIEQGAVAIGGDTVAFAASAPGLSAQLYSWRPESGAVLQRTFHFSEKRDLRMAASGRIVWSDTLFDSRSVFVWLP